MVLVGRVNPVVQGQKIARLPAAMHPADQADAADYAVDVTRILALGEADEVAVALVLDAVIHQ